MASQAPVPFPPPAGSKPRHNRIVDTAIDAKEAINIAMHEARPLLDLRTLDEFDLEEIEREIYKGREAWSITLSFGQRNGTNPLAMLRRQYKRVLIDVHTGELLALKMREGIPAD